MPIYEYQCSKCGEKYEVLQRVGEADAERCKFCKGKVSKLVSPTAFHLKGSGWYVTDYADKGKKSAAGSDEKTSSPEKVEAASASKENSSQQKHNDAA